VVGGTAEQTGALSKRRAVRPFFSDVALAFSSGVNQCRFARRIMEFDALNQTGRTQCRQDCVHLSLAWRPGEKPTQEQMEEAARSALESLGMGNAKAIFGRAKQRWTHGASQ
jgi:hypothetical protein